MLWEYKDQTTGITPAWAGKSQLLVPALAAEWDHPRVGGEKQNVKVCQHFRTGSPPRGRGKVKHVLHAVLDVGITPAWAGKRPQKPSPTASKRDHPRTGGEKWGNGMALPNALGSPPHRRGKVQQRQPVGLVNGITPA